MTKKNKKIVRLYLKEISAKLNCGRAMKLVVLSEIKSDIEAYTSSGDSITINDLYNEIGTPDDIANSLFDRKDYDILLKKAKRKTFILTLVAIILVILLSVSIYGFVELLSHYDSDITVTNVY